ncbi:MAG TPA: DUF86 domain-containing protein [Bacteroidales bacterium]|nr:DUF86 domain-containing protein [Bacteroidales bacterium]HNS46746.1 DUF86 domain-containing protein [Bacteroidales bacterium]
MKTSRTYLHFLEDIELSMLRIQEYLEGMDFISFKKDFKTIDAIIRNFEIIGEATKNLPAEFKEKNPQLPWEEMYRMRNKISHEYFGLDYEILWYISTVEIPVNYEEIRKIIKNEKGNKA